uniref:TLC domain-containing protein n=1 Tax=Ascaris lumbricoides TaxID=6252 RepID=A0A0M3IM02_ASCLU
MLMHHWTIFMLTIFVQRNGKSDLFALRLSTVF